MSSSADEAISKASRNADPIWSAIATRAVKYASRMNPQGFTSDDVWALLEDRAGPREPRALGAIFRRLKKNGVIVSTGTYRKSARSECHGRPVLIWRASNV
tara:strand:- start:3164 stop:3466 length:303 start_codon:yes stop_codon:yes gene_type:complete